MCDKTHMENVGSLGDCIASLVELTCQVLGRLAWIVHSHGYHRVHSQIVKVLQRVSVRLVQEDSEQLDANLHVKVKHLLRK
jgi:hypothetical protein